MIKRYKNLIKYTQKKLKPDPLFNSYYFNKFMNKFMKQGKKQRLETIFYNSFLQLKLISKNRPIFSFMRYIYFTKPVLYLIRKRLGANWITVPAPLKFRAQIAISIKWLFNHMKSINWETLQKKLENIFENLSQISKKQFIHKTKNKFYSDLVKERIHLHFRWK